MSRISIGIGISDANHQRLRALVQQHSTTQSELLSAVVSCMTEPEVSALIARYRKLRELEQEMHRTADANLMQFLRGRSAAEMDALIQAAKTSGES